MAASSSSLWQRSYLTLAVLTFLLGFLHLGDDFFRGEIPVGSLEVFGVAVMLAGVLYVFGLLWSWRYQVYGYWIVLVLSVLMGFWGSYLSHVFALGGSHGLTEIVAKSGALAPIMVATSLLGGVTSVSVVILAIYLLAKPAARTE